MAKMVTNAAVNPPMLTMPEAVPSRSAGLNDRAKSKPIAEAGPYAARTSISSHDHRQRGAAGPQQHQSPGDDGGR